MPDIGWAELLLIAAAALVFIGPKDLPRLLREAGRLAARARRAATEFREALESMDDKTPRNTNLIGGALEDEPPPTAPPPPDADKT